MKREDALTLRACVDCSRPLPFSCHLPPHKERATSRTNAGEEASPFGIEPLQTERSWMASLSSGRSSCEFCVFYGHAAACEGFIK